MCTSSRSTRSTTSPTATGCTPEVLADDGARVTVRLRLENFERLAGIADGRPIVEPIALYTDEGEDDVA